MRYINKKNMLAIIIFVIMLVMTTGKIYAAVVKDAGVASGTNSSSSSSFFENIEGSQEDLEPYTIESIIFNKVPLFDVNMFTDTAAGKDVRSDSVMGILRKIVAVWYVSFRNVALVVLAFLIIYYGIRLAISTVASEKAHYKEFLIGWLKSFIMILVMHYIIYIIFYANEYFVNMFSKINSNEGTIYNTIKTRALEVPWKISMPAAIMYLSLLFMWLRFIWTYFKRLFSVVMLIILAPLVGIRYSIENATGRGSKIVSNWFQNFSTTVLIQSVHAMLYAIFVQTALEVALDDLHGFIISLFFLNFMLSADTMFTNIFRFEFAPDNIKRLDKPFKRKEQLAEAYAAYALGRKMTGIAVGIGDSAFRAVRNQARRGYVSVADALDDRYGGNHRNEVEGKINRALNGADNAMLRALGTDVNSEGAENAGVLRTEATRMLRLRKVSRLRGRHGAHAKYAFKLKKNDYKEKFTSTFKIIQDLAVGTGEVLLLIPVTVQNPEAGIVMAGNIPTRFAKAYGEHEKNRKSKEKNDKRLNDYVDSITTVDYDMDIIESNLNNLQQNEQSEAVKQLKAVDSYGINHSLLIAKIRSYMRQKNIREIDDSVLDDLISEIVYTMPGELSADDRFRIKELAVDNLMYGGAEQVVQEEEIEEENEQVEVATPTKESTTQTEEATQPEKATPNQAEDQTKAEPQAQIYSYGEVATEIENAVITTKVDNRFANMAKALDEIKDINAKEERREDSDGPVIDINEFLEIYE